MTITDLVDTSRIRNVLTVSESDLPDSVLEGYGLEDEIGFILDRELPKWATYSTDAQTRALKLFCTYTGAAILAQTATVFILKQETDGANASQRSDKDGWLWLAARMEAKAAAILDQIKEDEGIDTTVSAPFTLSSRVVPDRDVITEARST